MNKNDKMILAIYIVIGIALLVIGATIEIDYYSTMIFAMGFGMTSNSVLQFVRNYHNTKPENIEAYRNKMREQEIDLKDERKIQLRNRAGYITWAITMITCFVASFVAALFRAGAVTVGILAVAAVVQYIVATVIYKYLCKTM